MGKIMKGMEMIKELQCAERTRTSGYSMKVLDK